MMAGSVGYARRIERLLQQIQPDAVVSEYGFPGSLLAAEKAGIPAVTVFHTGLSMTGPGIPPFASGLPIGTEDAGELRRYRRWGAHLARSVDATIARARRRLALPVGEGGYLARCPSPWLTLVLTAQAIEAPRDPPPDTSYWVGPCFAHRAGSSSAEFPFAELDKGRPRVYVSLGTVFNRKPALFRRIIDAFADGKIQLVISAGKAYPRLRVLELPPGTILAASVPQVELLGRVDAVISHGGNNTVNETLAAGKPLLVMPVGGEQADNAARVVHLGFGLRADMRQASSHEIRAKVDRLLSEADFIGRTRRAAELLAQTDGPGTSARLIERVAETGSSITRPDGYPITVLRNTPLPWQWV
jgi:MGT family glycosyltransferase